MVGRAGLSGGKNRKSAEVKAAEGNRGHRARPKPSADPQPFMPKPAAPEHLSAAEKAIWVDLVASLPIYGRYDKALLSSYCQTAIAQRQLVAKGLNDAASLRVFKQLGELLRQMSAEIQLQAKTAMSAKPPATEFDGMTMLFDVFLDPETGCWRETPRTEEEIRQLKN